MNLTAPDASLLVSAGISLLSLALLVLWPVLLWRAAPAEERAPITLRFTGAMVAWTMLSLALASAGILARVDQRPPPFMIIPVGLVLGVVLVVYSRAGALLARTPLWILVVSQSFRLPLELVMHQAAVEGTMPAQMTFGAVGDRLGFNYDIVSGVTALVLGLTLRTRALPKRLVLAWNLLGTFLLTVIVAIAIVSTPLFARFGDAPEQLNTWIFFPPHVLLPAVLVASALLGHVLVFRALRTTSTP